MGGAFHTAIIGAGAPPREGLPRYKLVGRWRVVPCDFREWVVWVATTPRTQGVVRHTWLSDGTWISTVFLIGLDSSFGAGEPQLFETHVFGGPLDDVQIRYATWRRAARGHRQMVRTLMRLTGATITEECGRKEEGNVERTAADGEGV